MAQRFGGWIVGFILLSSFVSAATLAPVPNASTITINDTIAVRLQIGNAIGMAGYQAYLTYDPTLFTLGAISEGPFLLAGCSGCTLFYNLSNSTSALMLGVRLDNQPVTGSGTLATVLFTAKQGGAALFGLQNALLSDQNAASLPLTTSSAQVNISAPATRLLIYDDTDFSPRYQNQSVKFSAAYEYLTGQPVLGANCRVTFNSFSSTSPMQYDATGRVYTFLASFPTPGIYSWGVNCSGKTNTSIFVINTTVSNGTTCIDADGDGAPANCAPLDCNDASAAISPTALESCATPVDDNCDGQINELCTTCTCANGCNADGSCITSTPPGSSGGGAGGGGGGGGGGAYIPHAPAVISNQCIEEWNCGDWSECSSGERTRSCVDSSGCGSALNVPALTESCAQSCANAIQDVDETGLDCGGSCSPCATPDKVVQLSVEPVQGNLDEPVELIISVKNAGETIVENVGVAVDAMKKETLVGTLLPEEVGKAKITLDSLELLSLDHLTVRAYDASGQLDTENVPVVMEVPPFATLLRKENESLASYIVFDNRAGDPRSGLEVELSIKHEDVVAYTDLLGQYSANAGEIMVVRQNLEGVSLSGNDYEVESILYEKGVEQQRATAMVTLDAKSQSSMEALSLFLLLTIIGGTGFLLLKKYYLR